jgi:hypothetical protein
METWCVCRLITGSTNFAGILVCQSSLSVVSCCHFHEKFLFFLSVLELVFCILFQLDTVIGL